MAQEMHRSRSMATWSLVRAQHGVVSRSQLLTLGWSSDSILHRIERGRLHPFWAGVYAVGRPDVAQHGRWMAAVLACGPGAVLSHHSAAELWGLLRGRLLLAGPRPRRRNRRPSLPPHSRAADEGPRARPGPHGRRPHAAALHPRAGGPPPRPRRGH